MDLTEVTFEQHIGDLPLEPGHACRLTHAQLPRGRFESFLIDFEFSSNAPVYLDLRLRFAVAPSRQPPPSNSASFSALKRQVGVSRFFQGNDFVNRNGTMLRQRIRLDLSRQRPRDHALVDVFNGSAHVLAKIHIRGLFTTAPELPAPPQVRELPLTLGRHHVSAVRASAAALGIDPGEALNNAIALLNEHKINRTRPQTLDDLNLQLRDSVGIYPARIFGNAIELGTKKEIEDFEEYNSMPETGHAILWLDQGGVVRGLIRCKYGALEKRIPRSGCGSHTALKLASVLRRLASFDHVRVPFEERLVCVRELCGEFNIPLPSDETVEAALQRLSAITWGVRKTAEEFHIEPESLDLLHLAISEHENGFVAW